VRWGGDGDTGAGAPWVADRHAGPEPPSRLQARTGLPESHRPGHPDRSELLRVPLVPPTSQRKVLVHPDGDPPRVVLAPVLAAHHDEAFVVLRARRIEQLPERARAGLTVREDHDRGRRVLVG